MQHFFLACRCVALLLLLAAPGLIRAQTPGVGIGTTAPDASAALDIVSSAKGALLPRLTAGQRLGISSPATGLLVFQTDAPAGFYYNAGTAAAPAWQLLGAGDNLGNHLATRALNLQGNPLTGTGASISGVGVGVRADGGLNLGQRGPGHNLLLGYQAGQALAPDSAAGEGLFNYFAGYQSGLATSTGTANVFGGYQSGYSNTSGTGNLFLGFQSGYSNTSGDGNHFMGYHSGYSNTTGFANHFDGVRSGFANTTGFNNQYVGFNAGANTTSGTHNLFVGYGSGLLNETGSNLTALGANSGPGPSSPGLDNATAVGANVSLTESNTVVLGNAASVGIGTSAPQEKLQVVGTVYSSTGGFRFPDNTVQTTAAVSAPANGFIQNQTSPQAGASFNVDGPGTVGGLLTAGGGASVQGPTAINTTGTASTTLGGSGSPVVLPGLSTAGLVTNTAAGVLGTTSPASLGGSFILNQTSPQAGAGFNVGGAGTVGGLLTAGSAAVGGGLSLGSNGPASFPATGSALEFVGPAFNTDPVGLYRVNPASDQSELRVVVGDAPDANDKFVVGRSTASAPGNPAAGTFTPSFTVQADGRASLGTVTAPDASAALDIVSSAKGALLPRLTAGQRLGIASPALGLIVYQTDAPTSGTGAGTQAGFWYNAGAAATPRWLRLLSSAEVSYSAATGLQVGSPAGATYVVNPDGANGTANALPFGSGFYTDVKAQYLLRPSLLTAAGLTAGYLAELAIPLSSKGSTTPYLGLEIQLGNTSSQDLVSTFATGLTTVYTAPAGGYSTVLGYNTFAFSQPFFWDGSSSIVVQVCYHNTSAGLGSDGINNTFPNYGARLALTNNTATPICTATTPSVLGGGLPAFRFRQAAGYTLSPLAGTAGQVLTQQASGAVTFQDPQWTQSGSSLYPQTLSSNVGIGTSTPTARLDVDGGIVARANGRISNQGAHLQWNRSGGIGETWLLNQRGGGSGGIFFGASDNVSSGTNTITEWARFDGSGNLGLGTTTPDARLDIESSGAQQLILTSSSTDPTGMLTLNFPASNSVSNTSTELVVFNKAGTGTIGQIVANLSGNAVNYTSVSDQRLKEHIGPTRYGLADLLQLRVKDYNFIGNAQRTTGLLAQELFRVYPDAVKEGDHGATVSNAWAVDYGKLTPLLVQAVQDQQQLIDQQRAQIEALQTRAATAEAAAAGATSEAAAARAQAAQATATLNTFEARLRALEAPGQGQARK